MARTLPTLTAEQAAGPPPFDRIGIVGLGLIGGSIAMAARRRWPSTLVVGVDANDILEDAQRLHAVDVAGEDLGMLAGVDLVVLCAPVLRNIALLDRLEDAIPGAAVVTDVGSTKQLMLDAARRLPARLAFIGGHPLAGAARSGIAHASAELFTGRPWILTPPDRAPVTGGATEEGTSDATATGSLARLSSFVRAVGAVPRVMSAMEHDHITAWVSHLPQLVASSLMRVIGESVGEAGLRLAGRGLQDTTRLASSPPHVWIDICRTNGAVIGPALDTLIAQLASLRRGLDDSAAVEDLFEAAAAWRARLMTAEDNER